MMNGRMYRAMSGAVGTQARSCASSVSIASTNACSGSAGMAIRCADRLSRAALAYGRNVRTSPSSWA